MCFMNCKCLTVDTLGRTGAVKSRGRHEGSETREINPQAGHNQGNVQSVTWWKVPICYTGTGD